MRIITWNVNSIRTRLPRLLALLDRHAPDVILIQETKVRDEDFPFPALQGAGYEVATHGQATYNGVAILARHPIDDVVAGFDGDPIPNESRVLSATVAGTRFVSTYVVNGRSVDDPAYALKLEWLDAFTAWLTGNNEPEDRLVVGGDFNITPDDRDVYDADRLRGAVHCSEPERRRIRTLQEWGLTDLGRINNEDQGPFTWWDYRAGAFHRGWGLRIDLILATAPVVRRLASMTVDRNERRPTAGEGKPSDHAPVLAKLEP